MSIDLVGYRLVVDLTAVQEVIGSNTPLKFLLIKVMAQFINYYCIFLDYNSLRTNYEKKCDL